MYTRRFYAIFLPFLSFHLRCDLSINGFVHQVYELTMALFGYTFLCLCIFSVLGSYSNEFESDTDTV